MPSTVVWFRLDLRLRDNPALFAAALRGPITPLFIWAPEEEGDWPPGAASRWWLHQSLKSLSSDLAARGIKLICRRGPSLQTLLSVARETGASAVYWNRRYEPAVCARDAAIKTTLREQGLEAESFNAALLFEPWTIKNKAGKPFQVFTPYWRTCLASDPPALPVDVPEDLKPAAPQLASLKLEQLQLEPRIDWAGGLREAWSPGEGGAQRELGRFLAEAIAHYDTGRDVPSIVGTSRLSPHLHFGEISPRNVWHEARRLAPSSVFQSPMGPGSKFLAELGWREFAHHLLYHFPHTPERPLRSEFEKFPWKSNREFFRAWKTGHTGFPFVDAGMRQLWRTGWMHNRVRMVVASFLVKNLLISWKDGARWFWDTLVDADLASNTLGWQWVAGCGADAAPFFRIFNPTNQAQKFDLEGNYIRRWIPELAKLGSNHIHEPAKADPAVLTKAGIVIGKDYPAPVISLFSSRETALAAYARIKGASPKS